MLSSFLASLGLEAVENGNPYISQNISQERIFNEMKCHRETKEILNEAINSANLMVLKHDKGTVLITVLQINFETKTVKTEDITLSNVENYFLVSYAEPNGGFVKAHVDIVLF